MAVKVFDETSRLDVPSLTLDDMIVRRVEAVGELLDASHDLLLRVFDPAVVDPKEVYVDALTDRSNTFRDFPPVFLAAVFPAAPDDFVIGFISSDLMLVGDPPSKTQLAIGNIATSPTLKELGFRGVGTTLWNSALEIAQHEAKIAGHRLDFSTSEAEPISLPFWAKLGYRWPLRVQYFQPPLEFNDDGSPVYQEVEETLVVHPLDDASGRISGDHLRDLVKSIYWNWNIRPSVRKLDSAALARAKEYVMGTVLKKTLASIPATGALPLVDVSEAPAYAKLQLAREQPSHEGPSR